MWFSCAEFYIAAFTADQTIHSRLHRCWKNAFSRALNYGLRSNICICFKNCFDHLCTAPQALYIIVIIIIVHIKPPILNEGVTPIPSRSGSLDAPCAPWPCQHNYELWIKKGSRPDNRTKAIDFAVPPEFTSAQKLKKVSERCHSYPHNVRNTSFLLGKMPLGLPLTGVIHKGSAARLTPLPRSLWVNTRVTSPGHSVSKILCTL